MNKATWNTNIGQVPTTGSQQAAAPRVIRYRLPEKIESIPLSATNPDWRATPNGYGDFPEWDFALCRPFRILDQDDLTYLREMIEAKQHKAFTNKRAITLRGDPDLCRLTGTPALEAVVSSIAGTALKAHPIIIERAHVNFQRIAAQKDAFAAIRKQVDDWHYDYMPYVLVIMISKSADTTGGRLITDHSAMDLDPGEGILMQGSHVKHMAEKAASGNRITLVVSFMMDTPELKDTTRILAGQPPFSPDEPIEALALQHRYHRLRRQCRRLLDTTDAEELKRNGHLIESLEDDLYRWKQIAQA